MKTNKQNIIQELETLNASFLLERKKKAEQNAAIPKQVDFSFMEEQPEEFKSRKLIRRFLYVGSLAASLVLVFLLFFKTNPELENYSFENINTEEALWYIEDDLENFTEDSYLSMLNTEDNNLFDSSGISNSYLEEYFINQLNEEIQLEDLL